MIIVTLSCCLCCLELCVLCVALICTEYALVVASDCCIGLSVNKSVYADAGVGWVGLGGTLADRCITALSKNCSLASNFHAQQQGLALHSSRVIPANNSLHGCKYSTGDSRTVWSECYYNWQFKEGIHPYSIRVCVNY